MIFITIVIKVFVVELAFVSNANKISENIQWKLIVKYDRSIFLKINLCNFYSEISNFFLARWHLNLDELSIVIRILQWFILLQQQQQQLFYAYILFVFRVDTKPNCFILIYVTQCQIKIHRYRACMIELSLFRSRLS